MIIVTVARKPSNKSTTQCLIDTGCGAIHIDACRVGTQNMSAQWDREWKSQNGVMGSRYNQNGRERGKKVPNGRWPSNLFLAHHPSCEFIGWKKVKGKVTTRNNNNKCWFGTIPAVSNSITYADKDGMETIENWNCHNDCPVSLIDKQSSKDDADNDGQTSKFFQTFGDKK